MTMRTQLVLCVLAAGQVKVVCSYPLWTGTYVCT